MLALAAPCGNTDEAPDTSLWGRRGHSFLVNGGLDMESHPPASTLTTQPLQQEKKMNMSLSNTSCTARHLLRPLLPVKGTAAGGGGGGGGFKSSPKGLA